MKKKTETPDDPVVAEIRAIRASMWQEAGGTPGDFLRLLDREIPAKRCKTPRAKRKSRGVTGSKAGNR